MDEATTASTRFDQRETRLNSKGRNQPNQLPVCESACTWVAWLVFGLRWHRRVDVARSSSSPKHWPCAAIPHMDERHECAGDANVAVVIAAERHSEVMIVRGTHANVVVVVRCTRAVWLRWLAIWHLTQAGQRQPSSTYDVCEAAGVSSPIPQAWMHNPVQIHGVCHCLHILSNLASEPGAIQFFLERRLGQRHTRNVQCHGSCVYQTARECISLMVRLGIEHITIALAPRIASDQPIQLASDRRSVHGAQMTDRDLDNLSKSLSAIAGLSLAQDMPYGPDP